MFGGEIADDPGLRSEFLDGWSNYLIDNSFWANSFDGRIALLEAEFELNSNFTKLSQANALGGCGGGGMAGVENGLRSAAKGKLALATPTTTNFISHTTVGVNSHLRWVRAVPQRKVFRS